MASRISAPLAGGLFGGVLLALLDILMAGNHGAFHGLSLGETIFLIGMTFSQLVLTGVAVWALIIRPALHFKDQEWRQKLVFPRLALGFLVGTFASLQALLFLPKLGLSVIAEFGLWLLHPTLWVVLIVSALLGAGAFLIPPFSKGFRLVWWVCLWGFIWNILGPLYVGSRMFPINVVHTYVMTLVLAQFVVMGVFSSRRGRPPSAKNTRVTLFVAFILLVGIANVFAGVGSNRLQMVAHAKTKLGYRVLDCLLPFTISAQLDPKCEPHVPLRTEPAPESVVTVEVPEYRGVVLIMVDALRFDAIGKTFKGDAVTPHLTEWFENSLWLSRMYARTPATTNTIRALTRRGRESPPDSPSPLFGAFAAANIRSSMIVGHDYVADYLTEADKLEFVSNEKTDKLFQLNSPKVTQMAQDEFTRLRQTADKFFMFVHYYDAHAFYVENDLFVAKGSDDQSAYWNEVRYVDHWMAQLLDTLSQYPDTAVIVMSDHGEEFGDHHYMYHAFRTYDESSRLLFAVQGEGIAPAVWEENRSVASVQNTVLHLLGAPQSSLPRPVFTRPQRELPIMIRAGHDVAVVKGTHKVIFSERTGVWEYYDLVKDPGESVNLADDALPEAKASFCEGFKSH